MRAPSVYCRLAFCLLLPVLPVLTKEVYKLLLDAKTETYLFWSLDYPRETVQLEIHFPIEENFWFALGFSDYGDFKSADLCVFWKDWEKNYHLEDVWTAEDGRIHVDKSQDCTNFRKKIFQNKAVFTFYRKFDTCDPHDYVIEVSGSNPYNILQIFATIGQIRSLKKANTPRKKTVKIHPVNEDIPEVSPTADIKSEESGMSSYNRNGTTHIVWASGNERLFSLEGVDIFSAQSKGFDRVTLLKNENPNPKFPKNTWTLEILGENIEVPEIETTYWCQIFRLPNSLIKKHHIIQYEPVIQKGNENLVHHMEVFYCEVEPNRTVPDYAGSCFNSSRPSETKVCKRVIAAWAVGATAFSYPEEAGLPVGGPQYSSYVMLEIHYNNPELIKGHIDNSGIRFHLTDSLRKYDAGVMELGLEYTDKMAIPPGTEEFQLSGYCVEECTAVGLPEKGIIVFASQLHTHLQGTQVYTRHIRRGLELENLNRDNHYSTHFQEIRKLKHFVRVIPGDALITTCTYQTKDKTNITLGGFSISDEMCVNYIHYYPKTNLEVCKSSVTHTDLFNYFDYLNNFEHQNTDSQKPISENYNAIEWTPLRIEVLKDFYAKSGLSMQCNQSSGHRFPGEWEGLSKTKILRPLHLEPKCRN